MEWIFTCCNYSLLLAEGPRHLDTHPSCPAVKCTGLQHAWYIWQLWCGQSWVSFFIWSESPSNSSCLELSLVLISHLRHEETLSLFLLSKQFSVMGIWTQAVLLLVWGDLCLKVSVLECTLSEQLTLHYDYAVYNLWPNLVGQDCKIKSIQWRLGQMV